MSGGNVRVVVVFVDPGQLHLIRAIREWCTDPTEPGYQGDVSGVERSLDLNRAVEQIRQEPANTILVAVGFEKQAIDETLLEAGLHQLEVIVHSPQWSDLPADHPSASLLTRSPSVTRREDDLLRALRKSILRVRTRSWVRPRVLESEDDFRDYFSLRYNVWRELGYLSPEKDDSKSQWELDYTDRTSLPLGFFAEDGALLACGRLVRGVGEEFHKYVSLIASLIADQGSPKLRKCFGYPEGMTHPFDVLEAFAEFPGYYCGLVRSNTNKAELSRVIVHPDFRRRGLGEVLVDSLVTLAKMYSIDLLFLACRELHEGFYRRGGFRAIPGMRAERFLAIRASVIAMDRRLKAARVPEEAPLHG